MRYHKTYPFDCTCWELYNALQTVQYFRIKLVLYNMNYFSETFGTVACSRFLAGQYIFDLTPKTPYQWHIINDDFATIPPTTGKLASHLEVLRRT